jgi:hypothetical protein
VYILQFCNDVLRDLVDHTVDFSQYSCDSVEIDVVRDDLARVFSDALSYKVSKAKFSSILKRLGVPVDALDGVIDTFLASRDDIVQQRGVASGAASGVGSLIDVDWSVRRVAASETLAHTGQNLVRISLNVLDKQTATPESVQMELSPTELDALISQLQIVRSLVTSP